MPVMLERRLQSAEGDHGRRHVALWLATGLLALAAALPARAAGARLPVWRVNNAAGHVLYLVGSMHALKPDDYPLPPPMTAAFERSDLLVEELDLNALSHETAMKAVATIGMLPPDQSLEQAMGPDWERTLQLAKTAGVNLEVYARSKPWFAAVAIGDQAFLQAGYEPNLGLDMHFAALARKRGMPVHGLETLREQLDLFDDLPLDSQRTFLVQTLSQAPRAGAELARLHAAWRTGDIETMETIADRDFAGYPQLRKLLLTDRNENWLPTLEDCLASGKTCFVVVGAEHMAGPDGLPALLKRAGDRVRQLEAEPAVEPAR